MKSAADLPFHISNRYAEHVSQHENGSGSRWDRMCDDVMAAEPLGLTCVCADVTAQQPRPGKSLSTGGAHTGQGV